MGRKCLLKPGKAAFVFRLCPGQLGPFDSGSQDRPLAGTPLGYFRMSKYICSIGLKSLSKEEAEPLDDIINRFERISVLGFLVMKPFHCVCDEVSPGLNKTAIPEGKVTRFLE